MKISLIVIAGLVAAAAMTLYLDVMSLIIVANLKVVKILGTMVTSETTAEGLVSQSSRALGWGYGLHYLVGFIFSWAFFYLLLKFPKIKLNLKSALWLGIIAGCIGVTVWRVFFALHPYPPAIDLKVFLINIFIGHIVYAFTLVTIKRVIIYSI
ncbi:MAG: hypothetical protein ACFCUU_07400 [Cyclobacteriaceae bacterium]